MYTGTTDRGRKCREDSLQACVIALECIKGQHPNTLLTVAAPSIPDVWYVYDSQSAADADTFDDVFQVAPGRHRWVAMIERGGE